MRKKNLLIFEQLKEVAKKGSLKSKHAAAVVFKNKIVSIGYNYQIPKNKGYYTVHAERAALMKCNQKLLKGSSLYVIRINKKGNRYCLSKPCPMCTSLINTFVNKYKMKQVYYSI